MHRAVLIALAAASLAAAPSRAPAAGTAAGVAIQNTAEVSFTVAGTSGTVNSNTVTVTVAEILDVVVTAQTPVVTAGAGQAGRPLTYRVTNTGNGPESFALVATTALGGDDFDPTAASPQVFFDADGNSVLSAGDIAYVPGANDPLLAPDAWVTIFVVNDIPSGAANGQRALVRLAAAARTGTGAPGTVFAGQGVAGTDAVAGTSGADGEATAEYLVSEAQVTAAKTASVQDPFGGARPVPGARIDYQIVVSVTGTGTAAGALFRDAIPPNTTYVPGSIRLNGAALSDASDGDVGSFLATPAPQVRVALGDLTQASGPQTIAFAVTIN